MPASVTLNAYNYRKSNLDLTVTEKVSERGMGDHVLDENYRTPEEGKRYVRIRAQEFLCREKVYTGEGTAVEIIAGNLITIKDHPRVSLTGTTSFLVLPIRDPRQRPFFLSLIFTNKMIIIRTYSPSSLRMSSIVQKGSPPGLPYQAP